MKTYIQQWLHYAALAAEASTGQAHWHQIEETRAATARREAAKPRNEAGFAPVLRAAD